MNNPSSSGSDPSRPKTTEPSRQQSQDAGSFSDAFESYQSDLKSGAENLLQQSSSMLDDAKNRAADLIEPAKERALSFAEEQKNAGAEQVSGFARVVHKVADDVGGEMPQAAGYIHDAAETLDNMSNRLRQNSVEELFASIDDFARQRPMLFFGGALVLGFALTRFLKSSSERSRGRMRSPGMHATPGEGWDAQSRARMDSAQRRSMPDGGPVSSSTSGSSGAKPSSGAAAMTRSPSMSGSGSAIPSSTSDKSGSSAQSVYGKEAKPASNSTQAGINPSIKGKQGDKS